MHEYHFPGNTKYDCMQVSNYGVLQGFHFYHTGLWGAVTRDLYLGHGACMYVRLIWAGALYPRDYL